jgi:hypothetical protein
MGYREEGGADSYEHMALTPRQCRESSPILLLGSAVGSHSFLCQPEIRSDDRIAVRMMQHELIEGVAVC